METCNQFQKLSNKYVSSFKFYSGVELIFLSKYFRIKNDKSIGYEMQFQVKNLGNLGKR